MQKELLLLLILLPFGPKLQGQAPSASLKKVAEFDLPGPPGKRFDYLTIDPHAHYLISAHLAAGQTYVIDLRTNKVVATVADTPGAEGVEYVSELKKFYTSNAGDNTIGVVDLQQMKVVKKLPTERKPDGSAYAAPFRSSQQNGPHSMAISSSDLDQRLLLREPNRMTTPQAMRGRTCQFPEDGNCAIDGVNRGSTQLRCSNDTSA